VWGSWGKKILNEINYRILNLEYARSNFSVANQIKTGMDAG
jgi:hypothetical protein